MFTTSDGTFNEKLLCGTRASSSTPSSCEVVSNSACSIVVTDELCLLLSFSVCSSTISDCLSKSPSIGLSSNSTPSPTTTVSNSENGRFTNSFIELSGTNEILSRPSITIRSPVLTSTLSRELTLVTLKVPKPFILTCLSRCSPSFITSIIDKTKRSASEVFSSCLSTK